MGELATWCVLTRKGVEPTSYSFPGEEAALLRKLVRGHRVVLTLGIVFRVSCSIPRGRVALWPRFMWSSFSPPMANSSSLRPL
jgi:hypothetical protein